MKKGLIIATAAIVIAGCGAGGYMVYKQKAEQQAFEEQMAQTISALPDITVYEQEDLPTPEEEFAGTESVIDTSSIVPDISQVSVATPGTYEVSYTFNDINGDERSATVTCTVKPDLEAHVSGMADIEIDKGEDLPTETNVTFDEYVDSVTLNTDGVDNQEVGVYDISYSILGADGDMVTASGYTCTVNELPDLTAHVTGLGNIEITEGESLPDEAEDAEFDSYVSTVRINTEDVDPDTPGTYDISYTIYGTNGYTALADGYICTVNEIPETETTEAETEESTEADPDADTAAEDGQDGQDSQNAMGNVEVQQDVVETGDETNIAGLIVMIICAAAAIGVLAYNNIRKAKKRKIGGPKK